MARSIKYVVVTKYLNVKIFNFLYFHSSDFWTRFLTQQFHLSIISQ